MAEKGSFRGSYEGHMRSMGIGCVDNVDLPVIGPGVGRIGVRHTSLEFDCGKEEATYRG